MKKQSSKIKRILLAGALVFGTFAVALGGYYSSKAYHFERETGGHYLGEVPEEIRGIFARKFVTPSDSGYTEQKKHSMNIVGNIEDVWDDYTGEGVTVAVIDDGFDHDHPEYTRGNGTSIISDDSAFFYQTNNYSAYGVKYYEDDPSVIDESWNKNSNEWDTHGTNTSSTALAPMSNGGIVGIAPGATLLALKCDLSFIAMDAAIRYAVDHGADVINLSVGAYADEFTDPFGQESGGTAVIATYLNGACNYAYNHGVIVVAAAGNEATWHKSYPACNNHVIGVGALYKNSTAILAPFTNYNASDVTGEKNVDILAPGFVYAAGVDGESSAAHEATYNATQGTSFSSPIVAGAAALWKQKNPSGTPADFELALTESAAGKGTYVNKMIETSMYQGIDTDEGPSNITAGRLDVGALMEFSNETTGISISPSSMSLYKYSTEKEDTGSFSVEPIPHYAELPDIVWNSSNTSVATVDQNGNVTAKGAGNATITARSSDDAFSDTATITVTNYISPESISIPNKNIEIEEDAHYSLSNVTVLPENATEKDVIFETADGDGIISINDDQITGLTVGSCTITAYAYDAAIEDFISDTINVTVVPSSSSEVTFNFANENQITSRSDSYIIWTAGPIEFKVEKNGNQYFPGTSYDSDPLRVYAGNKITISASGGYLEELYFNMVSGYSTISSTWTGATANGNFVTPSANQNTISFVASSQVRINYVTVSYAGFKPVSPTSVSLNKTSDSVGVGRTTQLTATVAPNNATNKAVEWTSANTNIATVSETGLVTGVAVGSTTITVTTVQGGFAANCTISVTEIAPEGITLDQASLELTLNGESETLVATIAPEDATNKSVTWTTSNNQVATVSNGEVTPVGLGECTITAKTINNLTATCTVTVVEQPTIQGTATYTITSTTAVSSTGAPTESSATFKNTYGTKDQLTGGNSMTLTLSGYAGLNITAITLSMHSNSSSGAGTFSAVAGTTAIATIDTNAGFDDWYDNTSYGQSYRDVHVTLTNKTYVVKSAETVVITIAASANSLYCQSFSVSYSSLVTPYATNLTLNETSKTLEKGSTFQIVPTVTMSDSSAYAGSITYASTATGVATVSNSGLVSAVSKGNATINVTAGDLQASLSVTVIWSTEPKLSSITVSNAPTSVKYRGTLDTSGIVVTAHYTYDGEDQIVTSSAQISTIDTTQIGKKSVQVTYQEDDIQVNTSFEVFVTNVGATPTATVNPGLEKEYSGTTNNNAFKSNNSTITLSYSNNDSSDWTIHASNGDAHFGYENSRASSQFGSSSTSPGTTTISSSDITQSLTRVTVYAGSAGSAKLSVTVGGTTFKHNGNNDVTLTSSSVFSYAFEGTGSGEIVITYTPSGNGGNYFQKVAVTTTGSTTYDWTASNQVASFINYLEDNFTGKTCAIAFDRDEVVILVREFNAMIEAARSHEALQETMEDLGGDVVILTKLKAIVAQYNKTLEGSEEALSLNLPSGSYSGESKGGYTLAETNQFNYVFAAIVALGVIAGAAYISLKARKQ